jgi:hypothetical protein
VRSSFGAATTSNTRYWLDTVPTAWAVLGIVIVGVIAALIISYRRFGRARFGLFAALSLPAVVAPLWYEVLRNHSQIHVSFVYANIPAALGIVLGAAILAAGPSETATSFRARAHLRPGAAGGWLPHPEA